jgi:hypothetical protein
MKGAHFNPSVHPRGDFKVTRLGMTPQDELRTRPATLLVPPVDGVAHNQRESRVGSTNVAGTRPNGPVRVGPL